MPGARSQFAHSTVSLMYTPQFPLVAFVDTLWLYENHRPSHTKERRLPDGSVELVINLHEDVIRRGLSTSCQSPVSVYCQFVSLGQQWLYFRLKRLVAGVEYAHPEHPAI